MSTPPKPVDFGPVGLAAALQSTPEKVLALVRAGGIRADFVRSKEPRWSYAALADVVKQEYPAQQDPLAAMQRACDVLAATNRAEKAEGWHDDDKGTT